MLALEHLRTDALLAVLLGAAIAMTSLRAAAVVCKRAVRARDVRLIGRVEQANLRAGGSVG